MVCKVTLKFQARTGTLFSVRTVSRLNLASEDLQRDIVELNQVLSSIKRCSVKEVILSEINLISAKIDSLKEVTVVEMDNVMLWSDVVVRRKKSITYVAEQTSSNTGYIQLI
jgi:hypothetical protein